MDEVMQLAGPHYLQTTLKPVLDLILTERKSCEIDPTRIRDKAQIEINLANLKVRPNSFMLSLESENYSKRTL